MSPDSGLKLRTVYLRGAVYSLPTNCSLVTKRHCYLQMFVTRHANGRTASLTNRRNENHVPGLSAGFCQWSTSAHRQSGFDCAVRNGLDKTGFADNGSAKCQRVFIANIFIKPSLTSGRDRTNREERPVVFKNQVCGGITGSYERISLHFCSFQRAVSFFSTVEILEKNPSVAEAAVDGLLLIQVRI